MIEGTMSGSQKNPFAPSVRRPGKAPERSNFAYTCNLLSQYVKERGTARDLNLAGIAAKSDAIAKPEESKATTTTTTTLDLLNNINNSLHPSSQHGQSVDPFSRSAPLTTISCASEHVRGEASSSMEAEVVEHKKPQMTIFYDGKVVVFDDFPAERAKEIMQLAGGGTYNGDNVCGTWETSNFNAEKLCSDEAVASSSKETTIVPPTAAQELLKQPQAEANSSDLPIARRSSLHRFLAKRKDRAVARGPYHLHNHHHHNDRPESSSKNDQERLQLKL